MIGMLIAVGALALWSTLATAIVVARDGYRQVPTLER
jgi:hypothetical protein